MSKAEVKKMVKDFEDILKKKEKERINREVIPFVFHLLTVKADYNSDPEPKNGPWYTSKELKEMRYHDEIIDCYMETISYHFGVDLAKHDPEYIPEEDRGKA